MSNENKQREFDRKLIEMSREFSPSTLLEDQLLAAANARKREAVRLTDEYEAVLDALKKVTDDGQIPIVP